MSIARPPETLENLTAASVRAEAVASVAQSALGCDSCQRLIEEMNSTFQAVHAYIIANRDQRAVNESYLGDLGRLIQAQVAAYRKLVHHQRRHA